MNTTVQIVGKIENLGKTITNGIGAEIRTPNGDLVVIPGLTHKQIRELGPLLFQAVTVTIEQIP